MTHFPLLFDTLCLILIPFKLNLASVVQKSETTVEMWRKTIENITNIELPRSQVLASLYFEEYWGSHFTSHWKMNRELSELEKRQ